MVGRDRRPGQAVFRAGLPLGQRCFQGSVVSKAGLFQGLDVIETADASHISAGPSRPAAPDSPAGAGRGGNPQRHRWNIGAGLTWPDDTDVPSVLPGPRRRPGSQVHRGLIGSRRTAWMLAKLERPALRGSGLQPPNVRVRHIGHAGPKPRLRNQGAGVPGLIPDGLSLSWIVTARRRAVTIHNPALTGSSPGWIAVRISSPMPGQGCFEASAALRARFACGQRAATAQSKRRGPG